MSSEFLLTGADDQEVVDTSKQVATQRAQATELCRTSLDFLASLILGEIYQYGYPDLFKAIWQMICGAALQAKGKPKYALGIPRGFSKTIFLKLYVVWLVLFSDRRFILVVCNTELHAFNFIADVADMLSNSNITSIFGDWRAGMGDTDTKQLKKFSFRGRDIIIAAIGAGSSPRGLNIKFVRPDVILMDDLQNRDQAANPDVAKEAYIWMLGTLMLACHPQRCVFIFVGNMYPFEGSILRKLKHSNIWVSLITGAILADGQSIWPEHRSVQDLLDELETNKDHPEIFYAEVMNDEEGGTVSGIDVSRIPLCPDIISLEHAQGGFVVIDPSLKNKKSDDTAIGAVLVFDGTPVLWEVTSSKMDPLETIVEAFRMCSKYGMQLIAIESVAYQSTLIFWMNKYFVEMGISGIHVAEITTGGMQKNARIRAWLAKLLSGTNYLYKEVRSQVIYQITQWNPLKRDNKDDVLDIGAYMDEVMQLYSEHVPLLLLANAVESFPEGSHTADLAIAF